MLKIKAPRAQQAPRLGKNAARAPTRVLSSRTSAEPLTDNLTKNLADNLESPGLPTPDAPLPTRGRERSISVRMLARFCAALGPAVGEKGARFTFGARSAAASTRASHAVAEAQFDAAAPPPVLRTGTQALHATRRYYVTLLPDHGRLHYYDRRDYCARKLRGVVDLESVLRVSTRVVVDGGAPKAVLTIETPAEQLHLVPDGDGRDGRDGGTLGAEAAETWRRLILASCVPHPYRGAHAAAVEAEGPPPLPFVTTRGRQLSREEDAFDEFFTAALGRSGRSSVAAGSSGKRASQPALPELTEVGEAGEEACRLYRRAGSFPDAPQTPRHVSLDIGQAVSSGVELGAGISARVGGQPPLLSSLAAGRMSVSVTL